jgi:hypothetical protein
VNFILAGKNRTAKATSSLPTILNQFVKKLAEFSFGCSKRFPSFFGGRILAPGALSLSFHFDGEIAFLLEAMQKGIDGTRTHLIAVPSQLFNHPEADQRLLGCVVENVQPDKTADKLAVIGLLAAFSGWGFSTHSRNPQLVILTYNQRALQVQSVL